MVEYWKNEDFCVVKENCIPVAIRASKGIQEAEELLNEKPASVSFESTHCAKFMEQGAYVVLDFGKELCGGLRFIIKKCFESESKFRITLGESLSEACSSIGEKNATNDHSPRDFIVDIASLADLTFGQSGFRFARIELVTEQPVWVRNIFAVSTLPYFDREGYIRTSDEELNRIIDTAIYTLKLNCQNGYIWDGIKRDRLVWCGDLNPEILTAIYMFGDNKNITNSLTFLKDTTPETEWINNMPTYSAWWVINLCDYCRLTGNTKYFEENKEYAKAIFTRFNQCITMDGAIDVPLFYLDWPTFETEDAVIGTASIIIYAANRFLAMEDNEDCQILVKKLSKYLDLSCEFKQTRAFQILAGRSAKGEEAFLEKDGAKGISTFMAYYILAANALAGGENSLSMIKEYFGAMLSRGATTFWEDFHMDWLEGSGRIDEFPKEGEKDIHGDYGAFCYTGLRHSLCHGWAAGVLAFIIEYIFGLKLENGGDKYEVSPCVMGLKEIEAKLPVKDKWLYIHIVDGKTTVKEI